MSARYGGVKTWLAWTDAEHARMVDMHRSGSTFAEIGLAIGRHPASIHGRMARTDANGNYIGSTANLPWPEPLSQLARRLRADPDALDALGAVGLQMMLGTTGLGPTPNATADPAAQIAAQYASLAGLIGFNPQTDLDLWAAFRPRERHLGVLRQRLR